MELHVAAIQLETVQGDLSANLAKMQTLGRRAKEVDPELDLLVFPELALTGYSVGEAFSEVAEPWPEGAHLQQLQQLAQELGAVTIVGYAEASKTRGTIYDSAAVFDRDGTAVASYRKAHCLDTERRYFANGDELPLVPTSLGTIGLMICWDAAFPEVARTHALAGADLLVTIGAWEDPYVEDWELVAAARAYDNVLPHVTVNRTGADGDVHFSGHSRIVDCLGRPISGLSDEADGLLLGGLNLEETARLRAGYGSQLRDRRPELYAAVAAPVAPSQAAAQS